MSWVISRLTRQAQRVAHQVLGSMAYPSEPLGEVSRMRSNELSLYLRRGLATGATFVLEFPRYCIFSSI